jgi:hypothetical protein
MGMYTELHFNAELRPDVPEEVLNVLRVMLGMEDRHVPLPRHPLFETGRWGVMLGMDSYYFDADTHSTLRYDEVAEAHFLCIRCNVKNYEGEIEKFVDWITPYLAKHEGEFLGFSRYEETEEPTLIYMPADG